MHYLIHETANVSYLNDCHGVDITELVYNRHNGKTGTQTDRTKRLTQSAMHKCRKNYEGEL